MPWPTEVAVERETLDGLRENSMRAMVLAMTVMAVALVQAQSKPSKSMPADVGSGRVPGSTSRRLTCQSRRSSTASSSSGSSTPFKELVWRLKSFRVDRPSGRFDLRRGR